MVDILSTGLTGLHRCLSVVHESMNKQDFCSRRLDRADPSHMLACSVHIGRMLSFAVLVDEIMGLAGLPSAYRSCSDGEGYLCSDKDAC